MSCISGTLPSSTSNQLLESSTLWYVAGLETMLADRAMPVARAASKAHAQSARVRSTRAIRTWMFFGLACSIFGIRREPPV